MKSLRIFAYALFILIFPLHGQINPTVASSTGIFSLTCSNPTLILTASSSFTGAVTYTWTNPQISPVTASSLGVNAPGSYTLSASSGTILETLTVSIVSNTVPPTVNLTSASASITCVTNTILLTATSNPTNVSYTWIEPGVGFACTTPTCKAAVAGNYGVTVIDLANGCQSTSTISIGDNRVFPQFNPVGIYTITCAGGTTTLEPSLTSGTTGITFKWNVPIGAITSAINDLNLTTDTPGEYIVIATNTINGCSTSTNVMVYICVGIEEVFQRLNVNVYPNPVKEKLTVSFDKPGIRGEVEIYNSLGKIIYLNDNKVGDLEIDFEGLSCGIYYLKYKTASSYHAFKVIKE